ncbi:MAG: hypothetical protein IT427_17885 [Pirellulales bacterium]|nr:hypothetical protein [Pirellulales bacterium]
MAIEFLCPNGHRVTAPDDRAGRTASCPRCNVRLRVPAMSGVTAESLSANGSESSPKPARQSDSGELQLRDEQLQAASAEPLIAFLCPNGHRLTGPARLQGKAGECPHCGTKFFIPPVADESQYTGIDSSRVADDSEALPMPEDTGDYSMRYSTNVPQLCLLLRKLWDEKEHGAVIELHLDGGAMMVPDWFDEHHSCDTHGLFANQAADGTITMTAVAWDSIKRVIVRNVEGMPDGMFE